MGVPPMFSHESTGRMPVLLPPAGGQVINLSPFRTRSEDKEARAPTGATVGEGSASVVDRRVAFHGELLAPLGKGRRQTRARLPR